jgi:hypothetical protein
MVITVMGIPKRFLHFNRKKHWITNKGKEELNTCNKYRYAQRFPQTDNTMRTKSSGTLRHIADRVVPHVSKDRSVFILKVK